MLRSTGQWQGNRTPDNQAANKLVDAGGIWFEDVGSTPTASTLFSKVELGKFGRFKRAEFLGAIERNLENHIRRGEKLLADQSPEGNCLDSRA